MQSQPEHRLPGIALPPLRARGGRKRRAPALRPTHLMAIFLGGMIGAVLRWALAEMYPVEAGRFPTITFIENMTGAFLLGLLLPLILERWRPVRLAHPLLCTGLLGSFTTFSNMSVELMKLLEADLPLLAVGYAAASVGAGLAAALLGMNLAKKWPPVRPRSEPHEDRR